jgi:hypothetical protein
MISSGVFILPSATLPGAKLLLIPCESLHKKQAFSSILSGTGFPVPSWAAGATRLLKKFDQNFYLTYFDTHATPRMWG